MQYIKGGIMPYRHIIGVSLFLISLAAGAEETKTTYDIGGSSAKVTTVIKKASAEKEKLLREYLFPLVAEKLRGLPLVASVEFNADAKGEVTASSWGDYWEHKRSFPIMVNLALGSPVSMMLRVEESFRTCKSVAEKAANATTPTSYGDYDGGSTVDALVDCTLESSVKITGPLTVNGNFASSLNMEKLLKDKQSITYNLSRDYSNKADLKLEGRFNIESELFDQNLFKFLGRLNSAPASTEAVVTRNSLLLGIARVLRVQNESMVEK
jgi:hypothetical protein